MNDNEAKEMFENPDLCCCQDTYAMVLLMKVLYDTTKKVNDGNIERHIKRKTDFKH